MNASHLYPGIFITFEGGDGAGKTTQINLLARQLQTKFPVVVTGEPGGTLAGDKIGEIIKDPALPKQALTLFHLFEASRAQWVHEVVIPNLRAGKIVLSSRGYDSTTAYQGYGAGLDLEMIREANQKVMQSIRPDLTLFFDMPPTTGLRKIGERLIQEGKPLSFLEIQGLEFHERVYLGFKALCEQEPDRVMAVPYREGDIEGTHRVIYILVDKVLIGRHYERPKS